MVNNLCRLVEKEKKKRSAWWIIRLHNEIEPQNGEGYFYIIPDMVESYPQKLVDNRLKTVDNSSLFYRKIQEKNEGDLFLTKGKV